MSMFFHTATVSLFIHIKESTQCKYRARGFGRGKRDGERVGKAVEVN